MKNDTATIYRFPILLDKLTFCEMPKGAVLMDVQAGTGKLNGWAMVDKNQPTEHRYFGIYATGETIPHGWDMVHLKTIMTGSGQALHLFEVPAHIAKKIMAQ